MIPVEHSLFLAGILFSLGLLGLLIRRNLLLILLSIELMLNASNLLFITGAYVHANVEGHLLAFFSMVIAAAEVTVGLAIIVLLFRKGRSVDSAEVSALKG